MWQFRKRERKRKPEPVSSEPVYVWPAWLDGTTSATPFSGCDSGINGAYPAADCAPSGGSDGGGGGGDGGGGSGGE